MPDDLVPLLSSQLPALFRWAGAIARQLRRHDIALGGKQSGVADTDALTIADLTIQEFLVAALRDMGPPLLRCRIEAEETSGDLARFASQGEWVLAIDPIDGTRGYRDRTSNAYSVMLHARNLETVHYSLVYYPEEGPEGTWLEVSDARVALGRDDHTRPAGAVVQALPAIAGGPRRKERVLVSGFIGREAERARAVTASGLEGVVGADVEGSLYPALARGDLGGALFHTPNVYDFPVAVHVARRLGGDAVFVADGRALDFRGVWRDERSAMLRLPGIVACALDRGVIATLVGLAKGWSPVRYEDASAR